MADSPYFDDAYFDPTYFDTDASGAGSSGKRGRRRRPPIVIQQNLPEPVDNEDWAVLIL